MKMISNKYLFLITVLLVVNNGCNKDNLNIAPTAQYSVETFWKTEEQARAGLSGCYRVLQSVYGGFWIYATDIVTPNALGLGGSGLNPLAKGVHLTTDGTIAGRWNINYQGVGRTNTFLDRIGGIPMNENIKRRMIGEARFLRALYYFNLIDVFGGVPLILETPDAAKQSNLPRDTKEKVVAQILKDLDSASAALPATYPATDVGRATKGAALALKARLLLYEGDWAGAAKSAKSVMDMNAYALFPDYRTLFMPQNEHNSEVIFNVEFLAPRFLTYFDQQIYTLNDPAPLKDLVDAYLMKDGQTIANSPLYDPAKPYENRDPRLLQTIAIIGYKFNGKITQFSNVINTGFGLKKYTSFTDDINNPVVPPSGDLNPIVMRYAEVLLTYAEAQNELSGPDASVYAAVNAVRARPNVRMPVVNAGLTQDKMRAVIRNERRVELAFEGLYYSDIRRWRTAEIVNTGPIYNYRGIVIMNRTFAKERDYLWPIPFVQIQENPQLQQNPNY